MLLSMGLCYAIPLFPGTPDHYRCTSQVFQNRRRSPLALRSRERFSLKDSISNSVPLHRDLNILNADSACWAFLTVVRMNCSTTGTH